MGETAAGEKDDIDDKSRAERAPLYWAISIAMIVISGSVAYRIVKSDGPVDVKGGLDGIQVKISQAQKTIESAQQEVSDAQHQLDARATSLKEQEQKLQDREAKVQDLLAGLERTASAPAKLTPQQAQVELKKLRTAPRPVAEAATMAEPLALKPRLDKLDELKGALGKTSVELQAASKPVVAPE